MVGETNHICFFLYQHLMKKNIVLYLYMFFVFFKVHSALSDGLLNLMTVMNVKM